MYCHGHVSYTRTVILRQQPCPAMATVSLLLNITRSKAEAGSYRYLRPGLLVGPCARQSPGLGLPSGTAKPGEGCAEQVGWMCMTTIGTAAGGVHTVPFAASLGAENAFCFSR